MEEPGGLQSMGLQGVRHNLVTKQQQRAQYSSSFIVSIQWWRLLYLLTNGSFYFVMICLLMNWSRLGHGQNLWNCLKKKWDSEGKGEGIMSWGWPNENVRKNILDNWIQLPLKRTMPRLEMHLSILPCVLLMQSLWNLGQCQQRRLGMAKTGPWAWSTYQPFRDRVITHIFMES